MQVKQVLDIATEVGYMLLKYGGEVFRAEQSARYICQFYGITKVDVFAIPNSIVVTVEDGDEFITKTRRILSAEVDLSKVEALNALSRRIGLEHPSYEAVVARLREIDTIQPYPPAVRIFAAAIVSFGFCLIFSGTLMEGLFSALAGGCAYGVLYLMCRGGMNYFLRTAVCSFVITAITYGCDDASMGALESAPMLAGALMILVPGLALANGMRDLMANDYVSGLTKFAEAIMTALATALGVAVVLFATHPM